ncbi:MAG: hypothetical protein M1393_07640 [Candidatus Thermoplasmatota archaeon]|nr:hypothetical protein [Candidatus Thermoplasmatota archaeon]
MIKETEIPVGRGKVIIHSSFRNIAGRGKYIILRLRNRPGSCNDADCQPIRYASIDLTEIPDSTLKIFVGEGYFLAVDQEIFSVIDRDRQTVILKKGFFGKYIIRGLAF